MKKALITGVTGQDGSYLAEFLLEKGYEVHGIVRRSSSFNRSRIDHLYADPHETSPKFLLHYGDLSDPGTINDIVWNIKPCEIYHLGAQSHVKVSFDMPEYTSDITGLGTLRILEALRRSGVKSRFYQASSSEMFGLAPPPQNENTPFYPRSPYAVSKVFSYWMSVNYRQSYGLFISNGILFNHESPRRGENFVTRKITRAVAGIVSGAQKKLYLGNLDARRDWGFAPEYAEAMWRILQHDSPDDFVVGTGTSRTVGEFVELAFGYAGVEISWEGDGLERRGVCSSSRGAAAGSISPGDVLVEVDPGYFRPAETAELRADIGKAVKTLGWEPRVSLEELVKIMMDFDMERAGLDAPGGGFDACRQKGFDYIMGNKN